MSEFKCERCGLTARYSTWVTGRWRNENMMQRCDYCGVSHSCAYGRPASAIPPMLLGIADPRSQVVSPWCDGRYRPYRTGVYECMFNNGLTLRLMWNGTAWTWTGLVVDTTGLLKWRGKWQRDSTGAHDELG